jgi:hypothetical protein
MGNFKYKLKEITPENTPDGIKVGDIKMEVVLKLRLPI